MLPPRSFNPPLGPPPRSPRERVLAQWRGLDLAPLEKAASVSARGADKVIPAVLQKLGLDRRRSETEVLSAWQGLLDPTVTAHARPAGLVKGTLFIQVDSSVWLEEIVRYRRREILDRLQHAFGKDLIRKISFRLG